MINYGADTEMVTLTWDSREGETYIVEYSTDLVTWPGDIGDGIEADPGPTTTGTYGVSGLVGADGQMFFRVRRE